MPPNKIKDKDSFRNWMKFNTPVHQAVIVKGSSKFLHFNEDFKVSADTIQIYMNFLASKEVEFYPFIICKFFFGGNSGNYSSKHFKVAAERTKVNFTFTPRTMAFSQVT